LTFSILNPREKSQTSTEYRPRWVNVIASSAQCGVSGMRDALQSSFKANYYWRRLKKMCYIQKITKYKNMSLCFFGLRFVPFMSRMIAVLRDPTMHSFDASPNSARMCHRSFMVRSPGPQSNTPVTG
jgi:hypothetical protein